MDKQNKNIITVLCSLVVALVLILVGVVAFNFGKDKGRDEVKEQNLTQATNAIRMADNSALNVTSTQAMPSTTTETPVSTTTYESVVHGDLYGTVGKQYLSPFVINRDGSGYYVTGGARRSLSVVSRSNGHMEVEAYLRGRYIGKFKGTYNADGEYLNSYDGTFYSVRGGGYSFSLYNPHD
jgi:hypothetical protein